MTNTVNFLEQQDAFICFVNTETPPTHIHYLPLFKYQGSGDNVQFFQLTQKVYQLTTDGITVNYPLYDWVQIQVKAHCISSTIAMIDLMKGAIEFKQV